MSDEERKFLKAMAKAITDNMLPEDDPEVHEAATKLLAAYGDS